MPGTPFRSIGDSEKLRSEVGMALRGYPPLSSVEVESAHRMLRTLDVAHQS
jgi:hypothetical protein